MSAEHPYLFHILFRVPVMAGKRYTRAENQGRHLVLLWNGFVAILFWACVLLILHALLGHGTTVDSSRPKRSQGHTSFLQSAVRRRSTPDFIMNSTREEANRSSLHGEGHAVADLPSHSEPPMASMIPTAGAIPTSRTPCPTSNQERRFRGRFAWSKPKRRVERLSYQLPVDPLVESFKFSIPFFDRER